MARRPRLTEADRAEWSRYARLIRPLPGRALAEEARAAPASITEPGPPKPLPAPTPPPRSQRQGASVLSTGEHPPGLDRASWDRFRTGKLAPARTLDLHGMTAERAYHSLSRFVAAAHAEHLRCVEVITGRGSAGGTGVIRRELPLWLNQPHLRPLVLAASHPHPANPGSVRLLLRRTRS